VSDATPWLTPAEAVPWIYLSGALGVLPTAVEAQLKKDSNLNAFEYAVLAALSSRPGRCMQMYSLAQLSVGSPSRLSHAISRLEKAGWVQRRSCPGSTRAVEAVLTDAGMEKLATAAPGHVREIRRLVFEVLSPAEIDQLGRICRKLVAAAAPQALEWIDEAAAQHSQGNGG
jgi:DNA-binding MarR family transcriptional regulator